MRKPPRRSKKWLAEKLYANTPKPASETKEGRARLKAYRLALGTFIEMFAKVEMAMHFTLRNYTKTDTGIARAVFSGVRAHAAADHLRRLAEIKVIGEGDWKALCPLLSQLQLINGRRNIILHYGAEKIAEGQGFATDALIALTLDSVRSFPISPTILRDMTHDLKKIFIHLYVDHLGRPPLRGRHPSLTRVLLAAWRYKPPPSPRKKSQKSKLRDQPKGLTPTGRLGPS